MPPSVYESFRLVSDLDRSVSFYEAIGLTPEERSSRRAEFPTEGGTLVLEEEYDEETLAEYGLEKPGSNRGTGTILVLRVDSVDESFERAKAAGATVLRPPQKEEWGEKLCLVEDPDGYVVELVRPL